MPWLQVKVAADPERTPAIEDALTAAGALSVTLEDAGDAPILEPPPGAMPLWGATRVVALFDDSADTGAIADALHALDDDAPASEPVFERLPDREWSRAWLEDWAPLRFGQRLWVAPFESPVDDPDAVIVRLDPGLAFGTGTHATTALCLEWLDGAALGEVLHGARVLDFGCGSGILAIAALRLGATHAHAVDIDPQALEATESNARANGVADRLSRADAATLGQDDPDASNHRGGTAGGPFDVVLANVLAGPLIESAATLARVQPTGGRLVLAGILAEQADAVIAAYDPGYALAVTAERDGWVLITGPRHER